VLLTLNAGSSSIKLALHAAGGPWQTPLIGGQVEGLGRRASLRLVNAAGGVVCEAELGAADHDAGLRAALRALAAAADASGLPPVRAVGHRVVHGGTLFEAPRRVDDAVLEGIAALQPLAPLHQPHNLAGIRAAMAAFPGVPQVACFDTAFHRSMPEVHQRFALPAPWHERGVRRYGFHGLSYESIAAQLAQADPVLAQGRVVVAHLGNGASMCALQGGRSVATTMSFSPLDGLPSGTRCGRLDPAVVLHLIETEGLDAARVQQLLSRESGWLGLSGVSSDMRELLASQEPGARLAVDHLVEHILRELAALAAALRGLDALVFSGGIGENAAAIRLAVLQGAAWLGLQVDEQANAQCTVGRISRTDSAVQAWVLRTNEEAVIARHTARVAGLDGQPA
jgi:acetate kinase